MQRGGDIGASCHGGSESPGGDTWTKGTFEHTWDLVKEECLIVVKGEEGVLLTSQRMGG